MTMSTNETQVLTHVERKLRRNEDGSIYRSTSGDPEVIEIPHYVTKVSLADQARADAIADFTASCERTVRGGQCTGCEAEAAELIPWSSQRLCWSCVDTQLDLLARAILEDAPVSAGRAGPR